MTIEEFRNDLIRSFEERLESIKCRAERAETLLRVEWWSNHSCDPIGRYGDDGEMSCGYCGIDFKRTPIETLTMHVKTRREVAVELALKGR